MLFNGASAGSPGSRRASAASSWLKSTRTWYCHTSLMPRPLAAGAEDRMLDAIADPYAQTLGRTGVEFEHGADRPRRGDGGLGLGLGSGGDAGDLALRADEQHVERDEGVLHPHRDRLLLAEIEQHSSLGVHLLAEHQPLRALVGR